MSCETRIFSTCILAGESLPFEINWTYELSNRWAPNSAFSALSAVRPASTTNQTGFEYSSSGGQSGPLEPEWPTTLGATVTDGSITWTAQALSNTSLRERIDTVNWPEVTDFAITPNTPIDEPGRQLTGAQIGSDVAISRADIKVEVGTTAGNLYIGWLKMKVR